jgi:hypothetical protein
VLPVVATPVLSFTAEMGTPVSMALLSSLTKPDIFPVLTWPKPLPRHRKSTIAQNKILRRIVTTLLNAFCG